MKVLTRTWIAAILLLMIATYGSIVVSCSGKQKADEAWVDSVLEAIDSIPDESLDFTVDEVPINTALDGNFNDFIYTFLHNRQLQSERVGWPLRVTDAEGKVIRTVRNRAGLHKLLTPSCTDYFVMLLEDVCQIESDASSTNSEAYVHLVDFDDLHINRCSYQRKEGLWMLNNVSEQTFNEHPLGRFLAFYQKFVSDSVYQIDHVAQPLNITMPDEEEETGSIEGTIDADQFPLFSPELPNGVVMFVDYGQLELDANRIVMVKCGMSNGMMDILTFEQEYGEWKLVGLEE